jgi:RNA polymerase sigma-70 factor (ECF subfamily)
MSHFLDIQLPPAVLDAARVGDSAARAQLYRALSKPVYTLIRRLVVRPAVAEELLHDVFIDVMRHMDLYRGEGSFTGWVRSIAISKALMHLRSPWHRRLRFEDAEGLLALEQPTEPPPDEDWHDQLERALNRLPAVARSIVWLHDVEGYKHAEIARLFGHSISFSKSQLARAHEQLRTLLDSPRGVLACTPVSRNS